MSIGTRAKRLTYLVHRWTGVAGCLLMVLWFISGVVMLYVGYPKFTHWERLGVLPVLDATQCCMPAAFALARGRMQYPLQSFNLTSVRGQPHHMKQTQGGAKHLT